jgi:hypothetical protein
MVYFTQYFVAILYDLLTLGKPDKDLSYTTANGSIDDIITKCIY